MQHWYVYHSVETMGYSYESLARSVVYSTSEQKKLCFGDVIWVIEGDSSKHKQFRLVDCFKNDEQKYPPFNGRYSKFKLEVSSKLSLIEEPITLNKESGWFLELHSKFVTKQRFFETLPLSISNGLLSVSGISL